MTQAAEEEQSRIEPEVLSHSPQENAAEKPSSPEAILVDALRQFVRHETQDPGQPEEKQAPQRIGLFQMVVLLVVVIDIVLLYGLFQDWFGNPLFKSALQVLPWLLGATAFAYSDKVRVWILAQCRRKVVGVLAILVAFPLLIMRQPVFSVVANVSSDSVSIAAENDADKLVFTTLEPRIIRITVPNVLKRYTVIVTDLEESRHSSPFKHVLGRWQLVRGTFAQLPLFGKLFGDTRLQLRPLYMVVTNSESGASATIEGQFDEDFLEQGFLAALRCSKATSTQAGLSAIHCTVDKGIDSLKLPPGKYNLTLFRDGCNDRITIKDRHVLEEGNDEISFSALCPS